MKSPEEMLMEQKINELKSRENLWNILYEVAAEFRLNLRLVRDMQGSTTEALQTALKQMEELQRYILAMKKDNE